MILIWKSCDIEKTDGRGISYGPKLKFAQKQKFCDEIKIWVIHVFFENPKLQVVNDFFGQKLKSYLYFFWNLKLKK